jgi:hypothetical protein
MDVLRELLRKGLLTEIGEGETRLTMARAAASALSERFTGDLRSLVPHAVAAAVDDSTDAGVRPLVVADEALVAEWETVRNAFDGPPLALLKAITLSALATAADKDFDVLAAGWYSLRTVLERLPAHGWVDPLSELASTWDDAVWNNIALAWSPTPASSRVTMPSVAKFDAKRIGVDTPAREQASTFVNPGNYNVFAQNLNNGYVDHVNHLVTASEVLAAEAHRRSVEELRSYSAELGKKLREILRAQEQAIESMRLRGELLWWQKTTFSPSRRVGYSTLEPAEVSLVTAYDLHQLMPRVAPLAVEHLLSGVADEATNDGVVSIEDLAQFAGVFDGGTGYEPAMVLDAIQGGVLTPLMARDEEMKAGRAAVLIFREMQARRLTAAGNGIHGSRG